MSASDLRSHRTMTRNIRAMLDAATADQYAQGSGWYADARAVAVSLFADAELGAGVIAALSPLTPWARNVSLAAKVAEGNDPMTLPTLATARRAVARLLTGEHWTEVLRGDKVRAFAEAIATAGQTDNVCVDRHARDIAYGVPFAGIGGKRRDDSSVTRGEYRAISSAYQHVARRRAIGAAQLQAITWTAQRGQAA